MTPLEPSLHQAAGATIPPAPSPGLSALPKENPKGTAHITIPVKRGSATLPATQPSPPQEDSLRAFWQDFGFGIAPRDEAIAMHPGEGLSGVLPAGVIAFATQTIEQKNGLTAHLKIIGVPSLLSISSGGTNFTFYRCDAELLSAVRPIATHGVQLVKEGDAITLPIGADFAPERYRIKCLSELAILTETDLGRLAPAPMPAAKPHPLQQYSMRDSVDVLERMAVDAKPLLGTICLQGQATAIFAPPNSGKTLVMVKLVLDAVREGRIAGNSTYYINLDDSGDGLAAKARLLADAGVHILAQGYRGFKTKEIPGLLAEMAQGDVGKGSLIIIDTLKRVASLMSKDEASGFTSICRQAVMKGATIVGLAHTNKARKADGKLQYAGTTDIVDDFDSAYVIDVLSVDPDTGEKTVQFEAIKRRGNNAPLISYAYAVEASNYHDLLASVRTVEADEAERVRGKQEQRGDAELIDIIATCIRDGINKKMDLVAEAASRAKVSQREANRLIERYTGTDPDAHRWAYSVEARGAKVFSLLSSPDVAPTG